MTQAYDVIPDIHADIDRLTSTLESLGYVPGGASWDHPEGRIAGFLGDFIDMGRANRSVLTLVRAMRDQGSAVAIMGNHELNALLYHRPGLNADGTDDGYMRAHSAKNRDQHQTFLDEFPVGEPDTNEMMDWFLSLPLFLDLGGCGWSMPVGMMHAWPRSGTAARTAFWQSKTCKRSRWKMMPPVSPKLS